MMTQLIFDSQYVVNEYSHGDQLYTHAITSPLNYRFLGHDPVCVTWYMCTKILMLDEDCIGTLITMVQNLQTPQRKIPFTFHQMLEYN